MICKVCGIDKPLSEFYKSGKYYFFTCKECKKKASRQYYYKNKEKLDKINKVYANEHKKEKREYDKKYREKHREHRLELGKQYRKLNRKKLNKKSTKCHKIKRQKDASYRILCNLRGRICKCLREKSDSTIKLLGCSNKQLKLHLEKQFKDGMSWDNYGRNGWHVDHIIPCASFDLSDREQQKKCFHYSNLQPLWAIDNILKSNKTKVK